MAHFLRQWTDAQLVEGMIPTSAAFRNIDEATAEAINGDDGGTWTPSLNINIGGQSFMVAAGPWVQSGSGNIASAAGHPIGFGKGALDDVFQLAPGHTGATRTVITMLTAAFAPYPDDLYSPVGVSITAGAQFNYAGKRLVAPLTVVNGSTLSQVVFSFYVGQAHANVPQQLPRFRVYRVDTQGNAVSLHSASGTTDANGYQAFPTPASGAAWYDAGFIQTYTYACDQNNVIDVSQYQYLIDVIEESGTNAFVGPTGGNYVRSMVGTFVSTLLTGAE